VADLFANGWPIFLILGGRSFCGQAGTEEYEHFKKERFGGDDTLDAHSDAFTLVDPRDRAVFEKEYSRSASLYFKGRPSLAEILVRIGRDLERL
jgi:hypothetical protein